MAQGASILPLPQSKVADRAYSVAEAATLAGVSAQTVGAWFRGRRGSSLTPLFSDRVRSRDEEVRLSFLEVSETIIVALLRRHGAAVSRLRSAREFTRLQIPCDHPFATEQFKLSSGRILWEFKEQYPSRRRQDVLVDFSLEGGQHVLPFYFAEALDRFDYAGSLDERTVSRYHPYGRGVPLVIDPRYGSGRLTVTDSNIRAEAVFARFLDGYTVEDIKDDLGLPTDQLKAVQRYLNAA